MRGVGGRPSHWENREELIEQIAQYFSSMTTGAGVYIRSPSMAGLGIWLGYASPGWCKFAPHQDVLQHTKQFIQAWREDKIVLPKGGVNPAAIMFLINRDDAIALHHEQKDATPDRLTDDRPDDAAALIDEVWKS